MKKEEVFATLRAHEQELRHRGVLHATLFGSVARDEATATIDIDIEVAPDAPVGLIEYVGITQYLADLFPDLVDVANRAPEASGASDRGARRSVCLLTGPAHLLRGGPMP